MDEARAFACQLRQAQADQGKTLEQAHQQTGISVYILQSLEAGEFTAVEPVCVCLALRAYAEHLGLNGSSVVR
ncbi:MAG: helix-turn-helix domain-containing protein [Candidatus Latescibacteria bacterium]|nr:helix-turn-helix domain-containing protein [Candidatus Latescibacterota bacterium]